MFLDNLRQDVRYAIRSYARAPSFTVAILATLALGIGASTAIFSMVDGILLRPLPLPDADRLVYLNELGRNGSQISVAWPDFLDWRSRTRTLQGLAISREEPLTLTGLAQPEQLERRHDAQRRREAAAEDLAVEVEDDGRRPGQLTERGGSPDERILEGPQ